MVIDRKNNISEGLVESFIKLLDFDEVKLFIPSIVVHETNKHLENQLSEVGIKIQNAIKSIEGIYGINGYHIRGLEVKQYKKNAKKELNDLSTLYECGKAKYLNEIEQLIKKMFSHRNCIIAEENQKILSSCLNRRVYKKAPFHHKGKEEYGDGLIVETLLHINEFTTITNDDEIIFVTGNTNDFSDSKDKNELHKDILDDLEKHELNDKLQYVQRFNHLIAVSLANEVEQANLKEDFEQQFQEGLMFSDAEFIDTQRETVGLTPLGCFVDKFLEDFCESEFAASIVDLFERINVCRSKLSDVSCFYYDDFPSLVSQIESDKISEFLRKMNHECFGAFSIKAEDNIGGIIEILEFAKLKSAECDFEDFANDLPDYLEYGEDSIFYDKNKQKFTLSMEFPNTFCESDDIDTLYLQLNNKDGVIENGSIELNYGFVEINDDGSVGESCIESVAYNTDSIVDKIRKIVDEFERYVDSEEQNIKLLKEVFNL
jgi:hypothetical protein